MRNYTNVIIAPVITEKSAIQIIDLSIAVGIVSNPSL